MAVWWAINNGQTVRSNLKTEFRKQIKEVYSTEESTFGATRMVIDKIQHDFACCGKVFRKIKKKESNDFY